MHAMLCRYIKKMQKKYIKSFQNFYSYVIMCGYGVFLYGIVLLTPYFTPLYIILSELAVYWIWASLQRNKVTALVITVYKLPKSVAALSHHHPPVGLEPSLKWEWNWPTIPYWSDVLV